MTVMELLQLYGIPIPVGLVLILVFFTFLYLAIMRFLDKKTSGGKLPKAAPQASTVTAPAAPNTGNNAITVAISAAVNEYRKNNL